jgi:hypothetical protein
VHDDARELRVRRGFTEANAMVVMIARDADAHSVMAPRRLRESVPVLEHLLPAERFGCVLEARADEVVSIVACEGEAGVNVTGALRADCRHSLIRT